MRLLVQRISEGWVEVADGASRPGCPSSTRERSAVSPGQADAGEEAPHGGPGLLALVGFRTSDAEPILEPMAAKLIHLRIMADADGRMNRSLADTAGCLVLVPQFTLYGDCRQGRRPSFFAALPPEPAEALYDRFVSICRGYCVTDGIDLRTGRFGAAMRVHLVNDGPVTLLLDSTELGLDSAAGLRGS